MNILLAPVLAASILATLALDPTPAAPKAPADVQPAKTQAAKPAAGAKPASDSILDLSAKRIDGADESLSTYSGKVVLIVNVASKCGYTKQYEGLEKLYKDKKDKGLVILGFPSNDFGKQEPGSNTEIAAFCSSKFGVTFPMFEKIAVKGEQAHPLYQRLAAQPEPIGGEPKWNFTKFLVDRSGKIVARYESKVAPDDAKLLAKIDELLGTTPGKPEATTPAGKK